LTKDAIVESDGDKVQKRGCSTSTTISKDHVMKVVAEAIDEIAKSATSSNQLQDNVENRVLRGDSSVSSEKHSISVQARLKSLLPFTFLELIVHIYEDTNQYLFISSVTCW